MSARTKSKTFTLHPAPAPVILVINTGYARRKKSPALRGFLVAKKLGLYAVVHVVFTRMHGQAVARDFGALQVQIAVDHVIIENTASR